MTLRSKLKLILLLCCLLAACSPTAQTATPSPLATTAVPTASPTLTITSTATISPTTTIQPTETWVPPLPQAEAEQRVIELLRDNGGCQLPCFWGFVPGQTTDQTFTSQLSTFRNLNRDSNPHAGSLINILTDDSNLGLDFSWPYTEDPFIPLGFLSVSMANYRVVESEDVRYEIYAYENPNYSTYTHYYSLSEILSNYGTPDRVIVYPVLRDLPWIFEEHLYLFLDYAETGWNILYTMLLTRDEEHYIGCPAGAWIDLSLWTPEDTDTDAASIPFLESNYNFPIEEATSLSLDEFHEQFQDPAQCLKTPIDIWPQSAAE